MNEIGSGAPGGNPYAPPVGAQEAWDPATTAAPQGPPSSAPKIFGVLSIIFGSLVLLGGLLGACGGLIGRSFGKLGQLGQKVGGQEGEMLERMMTHMGSIYSAIGVQSLIFAAMSGWLLAIGIGQLRYRRWARGQTVYWSAVALVVLVGVVLLNVLWIGPAYEAMFADLQKATPSGALPSQFTSSFGSWFGGTSGVMTVLLYAPYPVLMLIYFTREAVRAAMVR